MKQGGDPVAKLGWEPSSLQKVNDVLPSDRVKCFPDVELEEE